MRDCYVTAVGSSVPAASLADWLNGAEPASAFDPARFLDRRKVRYKDRATTLALAAAQDAIDRAGIRRDGGKIQGFERTGVVAASAFGNLDTICRAVDCIAEQNSQATSPLDLPNASPNVLSASIAIYFGAGALNIMTTNGRSAGLDALAMAVRALRAGRADRMIVVGAESANDPLRRLFAQKGFVVDERFEGAAAVVLDVERPQWRASVRLKCARPSARTQREIPDARTKGRKETDGGALVNGAHRDIARFAQAVLSMESGLGPTGFALETEGSDLRVDAERIGAAAAEA